MATNIAEIDPDLVPDLLRLTTELEEGRRVPQPRLRYRFQEDKIGLQPSRHRLVGHGEELSFDFDDDNGLPAQQVLGAVYAAGRLDRAVRSAVMQSVRRAVRWEGGADGDLIATLAGVGRGRPLSAFAFENPVSWAIGILRLDPTPAPPGNGERCRAVRCSASSARSSWPPTPTTAARRTRPPSASPS